MVSSDSDRFYSLKPACTLYKNKEMITLCKTQFSLLVSFTSKSEAKSVSLPACLHVCLCISPVCMQSHLHSLSRCYQTLNTCSIEGHQLHKKTCFQHSQMGIGKYTLCARLNKRGRFFLSRLFICGSCHPACCSQVSGNPEYDLEWWMGIKRDDPVGE